jgi:hypothetical protein
MKKYIIFINFDMVCDHVQVITDLQYHFQNVNIICDDCLKIIQYMREAYRGVVIAQKNMKVAGRPSSQ